MPSRTSLRWTPEQAWSWQQSRPWICGCNYIPANAINCVEMFMDYGFDPAFIEAELALAQRIGFNCIRVFLPFIVWEQEPLAFKARFAQLLEISQRRGIGVMPALFDDCAFGPALDPVFGRQPAVIPGFYANGWVPTPGHTMVRDASTWPRLERFVRDILTTHAEDPRILLWDLYNEPTNGLVTAARKDLVGEAALPLLEQTVRWARESAPSQPITVGEWNADERLNALIQSFTDIVTFHEYGPAGALEERICRLRKQGRPLLCTEWMNRGSGSLLTECLPVFAREKVGALHWGLVNGRTQTHLNWEHLPGQPEPACWQHDLFRGDHTPYAQPEIDLCTRLIAESRG